MSAEHVPSPTYSSRFVVFIATVFGVSCIGMGLVQSAAALCLGFVALRTFR